MAEDRDYYEILGIDRNADAEAIKSAYRKLAKKYHPDLHPGDTDAEKHFKEVNEAYSVLSDPDKKAKYDQFGKAAFDPPAADTAAALPISGILVIFSGAFSAVLSVAALRRGARVPSAARMCRCV